MPASCCASLGTHRQARRAHQSSSAARRTHARTVIHTSRAGETLSGIAIRYRVTVEAIAAANRLANPSFIRTGQQLRIPAAQRSRPARPSHHAPKPRVGMPPSMAAIVRQRIGMRHLIVNEARRQHFPRAFALAVAWQESGWQERVVSSAGAIGVMQLLPATADWVSATMLGEPVNLWKARSNVRAGVALLKHYLARYGRPADGAGRLLPGAGWAPIGTASTRSRGRTSPRSCCWSACSAAEPPSPVIDAPASATTRQAAPPA